MGRSSQRRRAIRHPAAWSGRYQIEESPERGWRDCRVIDVSMTGAAVEPFGLGPDEIPEGTLGLDLVPMPDVPEHLHLRGDIRHRTRTSAGRVRVGIEFVGLSTRERDQLQRLLPPDTEI
jgi:c-di-GMP-binding flagellar brake protein YcgR